MSDQTIIAAPALDLERIAQIRQEFPILARQVGDKPLIYLDNAASSQKPEAVLQVMDDYYRRYNANVHRGLYELSRRATDRFEEARRTLARRRRRGDDVIEARKVDGTWVAYGWERPGR